MTSAPSTLITSQVQPEPNSPVAACANRIRKSSTLPNARFSASSSFASGGAASGVRQFQKNSWFQAWATLLKTAPEAPRMIYSIGNFSNRVPRTSLFAWST
jgi:hypothetical protein